MKAAMLAITGIAKEIHSAGAYSPNHRSDVAKRLGPMALPTTTNIISTPAMAPK